MMRMLSILSVLLLLAACASRPYQPRVDGLAAVMSRAESQTVDQVRVSVAVLSAEEAETILGLPLYDRGVQPVWLEVENRRESDLRYAPVGTDRDYIPPLEVAYTNKAGFSSAAHEEMERYLHDIAMPRDIGAGELRSGFVFTQARPGTKAVNVDLFGAEAEESYSFLFFVTVPGFVADHAQVNFEAVQASFESDGGNTYDLAGLRRALGGLQCCSRDSTGAGEAYPLNLVMVGDGDDMLGALVRAGWFERAATERGTSGSRVEAAHLYGRPADAVFRKPRGRAGSYSELSLWMAPFRLGEQPIAVGHVLRYLGTPEGPIGLDPDIDDARNFLLQDVAYTQGLAKYAWIQGPRPVSLDRPGANVAGERFFTDGFRVVLWPSARSVSLTEIDFVSWDKPPVD
jgi:hypothetical protein